MDILLKRVFSYALLGQQKKYCGWTSNFDIKLRLYNLCFVVVVVVVSYPLGGTRQGFEGLAPVVLYVLLPGPPLTVSVPIVVVVGCEGGPDDDRHPEKMNAAIR